MHAVVGDGVFTRTWVKGADVVVRADVAAVHLTGVDGAASSTMLSSMRVLGPMTQPAPMTVLPRRMVPARNDGTRGDDHVRCDLHGAAVDDHAVCDVLQQNDLAGRLLAASSCSRAAFSAAEENRIFHTIDLLPARLPGGWMIRPDQENDASISKDGYSQKLCADKKKKLKLQG